MKRLFLILFFLALFSKQSEGKEIIRQIIFQGNQAFSSEYLKKVIQSKASEEFDEYQIFKKDRDKILNLYRRNGYLDVQVGIEVSPHYTLKFQIHEGQQIILKSLKIVGNEVFSVHRLLELITINNGEPLDLQKIYNSEYKIVELYASRGYIYTQVNEQIERDAPQAFVTLIIEEGIKVKVGDVEVRGLNKVDKVVVLRELELKSEDIFTPKALSKTRQNVYATGLFRNVYIETRGIEEQRERIDLILHVEEDKMKWIGAGLGYGSLDGARLSLEWGYNNLAQRGQKLALKALISYNLRKNIKLEVDKVYSNRFSGNYFIPWLLGTRFSLDTRIVHQRTIFAKHEEEQNNGALRLSRKFRDKLEIAFQGKYQVSNIFRVAPDASGELKADAGRDYINSLLYHLQLDTRDSYFKPRQGAWLGISDEYAGGILGGSVEFNKTQFDVRYFLTIFDFFILGMRGKVGYVFPYGATGSVPRTERFFLGGPTTVRGHLTDHVGITTMNEGEEEAIGGRAMSLFNVEVSTESWKNFYLGVFADGGYVWQYLEDLDLSDLEFGYGVGLRYATPVGPIRMDFAYPVREDVKWKDVLVHIALGPVF